MRNVREHRVLIVAENVSSRFGGEAFLPLHYFRVLRARGITAFLLTHARVREELGAAFPDAAAEIEYIPDTIVHRATWQVGRRLPKTVDDLTFGATRTLFSQELQRRRAKEIVHRHRITIVHQPIPVSPRWVSSLVDVGAPVVIGPMNGNMSFPPGFRDFEGPAERALVVAVRAFSSIANRLVPGKSRAATLLVANERTRAGLPASVRAVRTIELVENGVDLARFVVPGRTVVEPGVTRFAFVGRLVGWKAVNLLLAAFSRVRNGAGLELHLFGDGPERRSLEGLAERLSLRERVKFHGFLPQEEVARRLDAVDCLVLPSLYECGGAVVLEAMAKGLPVIATKWGGPADYLDDDCGILVEPRDREQFVAELSAAIDRIAADPELRLRMGRAGRAKVEREYDWERKVDRMLEIYAEAASEYESRGRF
ncbi:MAG: glycosyltransferase family 4 protein [Polyangiaceae bacterium]|nr:glycosyltransferase family 4 protein [Polyangiaceae bacterium]